MDKAPFFILNVFLNSLFAFFTAAFLIEGVIFLFRIKQGRITALLRMIPILKLPLDLLLYDFSRWSYIQGINPLNCEKGTRTLFASIGWTNSISDWFSLPFNSSIRFTVPGNMTFTIADVIGYMMSPIHLKIFSVSFLLLSTCFFIKNLVANRCCIKALRSITSHSEPVTKKMSNPHLIMRIKRGKYSIFASACLQGSPFVAGVFSPIIYIPSYFVESLTRREYEAVIAHEIEHIRHRDIFVRLILNMITSIFWWIPTKWLRNRIEAGQEMSCDCYCRKCGVDAVDLASAIYKSAKHMQGKPAHIFADYLAQHRTLERIKMLMQPVSKRFRIVSFVCNCLAASMAFLLILFGRFWIF